jgi:GTP-binding protein SAR1
MFLVDWFFDFLSFFSPQKKCKVLFLGLDNAGKTTLLTMLKDDRIHSHCPTIHPNHEELTIGKVNFAAHDLGGHEAARMLWTDYYATADGIVFLVDALDRGRFPEAKRELDGLLTTGALADVPVVILGNKIDAPRAASENELRTALNLHGTSGKGTNLDSLERPVEIFMCSVVRKMGYSEGAFVS